MNERDVRRELDRLDHENVVDLFATIPERQSAVRTLPPARGPRPRRARRLTPRTALLALVAIVGTPTALALAAPQLIPERVLDLVGRGTSDHYAFIQLQPGTSGQPVGWDPCRPVDVVVNPSGAPADGVQVVREAMAAVHKATGITLHYDGLTGDAERRLPPRGVVVSWAGGEVDRGFEGSKLGHAASDVGTTADGHLVYVRGFVTLSRPAFAHIAHREQLAVTEHEFGHVMGLDHVQDKRQLMYPTQQGRSGYAAGDLGGLATLGQLPCR